MWCNSYQRNSVKWWFSFRLLSCFELIKNFMSVWVIVLVILHEGEFTHSSLWLISGSVLLKQRHIVHSLSVSNILFYKVKRLQKTWTSNPTFNRNTFLFSPPTLLTIYYHSSDIFNSIYIIVSIPFLDRISDIFYILCSFSKQDML